LIALHSSNRWLDSAAAPEWNRTALEYRAVLTLHLASACCFTDMTLLTLLTLLGLPQLRRKKLGSALR
jgi:hypothetical protein